MCRSAEVIWFVMAQSTITMPVGHADSSILEASKTKDTIKISALTSTINLSLVDKSVSVVFILLI